MALIYKFPAKEALPVRGNTALEPAALQGQAKRQAQRRESVFTPAREKRAETEREERRKAMLAKVHIALPQLYANLVGFTEDVYRYTLYTRWGVESSGELDLRQLDELLKYLRGLGATLTRGRSRKQGIHRNKAIPGTLEKDDSGMGRVRLMKKIEALLAEKGRVEGTFVEWEYAKSILRRITKGQVKAFEHATDKNLRAIIAILIKDAQRKGRAH